MNMLRDMLQPTRRNMLRSMFTSTSALTRFGVNGVEAALALDFIGSEYRTGNSATTFADAFMGNSPRLTYNPGSASSSQSTMTQGYGPELVTNGDFATDTDWTLNGSASISASISGGVANLTATNDAVKQDLTGTQGTTVEVSFTANRTSGTNLRVYVGGSLLSDVSTPTGTYTYILEGGNTDNEFQIRSNGFVGTISNISVREAPKIVWAPHNLVTYSEDFSAPAAVNTSNVTLTQNYAAAPDDSMNAERLEATGTWFRQENYSHVVGQKITTAMWVKSNTGSNQTFRLYGDNNEVSPNLTATTDWKWFSWEFTVATGGSTGDGIARDTSNNDVDLLIFGRHSYRSDLGGMAPVPGAVGDFQYYVPTNGAAEYLPRVGHHVYNGSTWVNEGLLIESEVRTNLFPTSNTLSQNNVTPTTNSGPSPSGQGDAVLISNDAVGPAVFHYYETDISLVQSTQYTLSCYVKYQAGSGWVWLLGEASSDLFVYFNVDTGTIGNTTGADGATIEECGNNWYRISATFTKSSADKAEQIGIGLTTGDNVKSWDSTGLAGQEQVLVYGFQLEAASTPSSYIPTNGSTVIRGGQSLTVPANWYDADNPTYTGPELVTDFSTYASEAEFFADGFVRSDVTKVTFDATNDTLDITDGSNVRIDGHVPFVEGVTYEVSITNDGPVSFQDNFSSFSQFLPAGTSTFVFTKSSGDNVRVVVGAGNTASISNISVRQVSAPQFGWPEPEFIGPELVDNGDFSLGDNGDWTLGGGWSIDVGNEVASITSAGNLTQNAFVPSVQGKVLMVSYDIVSPMAGSVAPYFQQVSPTVDTRYGTYRNAVGSYVDYFVVQGNAYSFGFNSNASAGSIDNISVREINPLSVSIQMDGRMTYADEGVTGEVRFFDWVADGSNSIRSRMDTTSGSGLVLFRHAALGTVRTSISGGSVYSPGVNVPFNIASRYGSTFVRGSTDGTLQSLDTTPTALPDLSGSDLRIANSAPGQGNSSDYPFMGTIGQFRQFAGDIGDTGLVTATNPSTEPTLSLTFDGTEGSFYNLSWSE